MAQQTFSGVPGDFSAGQVLTAADMDKLREFLLYLIKDGDETDTGEVSPLILDLNDNRVGVNTDAPAHELDVQATGDTVIRVKSNATGTVEDDDATLIIDCADTGESVISFQQDGVEKADIHWFSAGQPDLNIRTASGTDGVIDFQPNGDLAVRILADGTVSIGKTSNDGKQLEVYQASNAGIRVQNSTTGTGATAGLLLEAGGSDVHIWNYENGYMRFGTNNTERMRILANGNVGIGAATAASLFTVAGNIRATGSLIIEGTSATAIRMTQTDTDGAYISVTETDGSTRMGYMGFPSSDNLHLKNETGSGLIYLSTNSTTRMSIAAGGLVNVVGEITAGTKTFDIPHPTKGGDWRLRHASIEGPRNDLIYRGTVTLSGGTGTVDLDTASDMTDGTWQALCRDPWAMVASSGNTLEWSLSGKTLTVTSDTADAVCSWMVIAERHDDQVKGETCPSCDDDGYFITEYEKEPDDEPDDEPDEPEDEPDEAPEGAA